MIHNTNKAEFKIGNIIAILLHPVLYFTFFFHHYESCQSIVAMQEDGPRTLHEELLSRSDIDDSNILSGDSVMGTELYRRNMAKARWGKFKYINFINGIQLL